VTDGRALARIYLEQQRLLGGDRVILPEGPSPRADGRSGGQAVGSTSANRTADPGSGPTDRPTARPPDRRTAAAELPPPGISFDPPGGDLFASDPIQQAGSLDAIATLVRACTNCRLCDGRRNAVPGEGPADARLVVVGEGPGRVEDETGRPFVGQAGELLTKILAAIDLPRERVFICNVVKCRPPENRLPQFDEIAACVPYLFRQIEIVNPKVILAMGGTAAQTMLNTKQSLGALRNFVHRFRGIPLIVTYHPAALLRNPNWKKPTWDDVRIARRLID
jgi:uracil-DNA glycosylase